MEILDNNTDLSSIQNCVMTIGNFDGIHIGHSKIIDFANELAANQGSKSLLVTFNPHPIEVLNGKCDNYIITDFEKKMSLLAEAGLDFVYVVNFDDNFANIEADNFVKEFIYRKFNPSDIIVGYDHFFGKDRKGSFDLLKKYKETFSYELHRFAKIRLNNIDVKSSMIRRLIKEGKVKDASKLLGRPFSINGRVVKGKGRGTKLLAPTANIQIENLAQLIPKNGVYHADLFIKKDNTAYDSVCNIGIRPTFNDGNHDISIEAHILSEGEFDIYGYDVELIFKNYIREEIKFNDEKELINQINLDKEYCINN